MANIRVKINRAGVRQLLRSPGVANDLRQRARRIAAAAGPGMEVHSEVGRNRARAAVVTGTFEAMHAQATRRSLTRAVDSAR